MKKPYPSAVNSSTSSKLFHVGEGRFGAVPLGWLPHLRGRTLVVYVALAAHVDPAGYCYPSKKTIADASGIREDYVRLELRELEKIGAIKTEQRFRQSSQYRLMPPLNEGTQIEGAQIEDRGDSNRVNEGTQNEGTRGLVLSPHNKPGNIDINKTSRTRDENGHEKKKNDEGRIASPATAGIIAQIRAQFHIKPPVDAPANVGAPFVAS